MLDVQTAPSPTLPLCSRLPEVPDLLPVQQMIITMVISIIMIIMMKIINTTSAKKIFVLIWNIVFFFIIIPGKDVEHLKVERSEEVFGSFRVGLHIFFNF